nr:DUF1450 domain-containing protein [Alicyclobacillus contaminans]
MGIIVVEVCEGNRLMALDVMQLEQDYPEVSVLISECLSFCALCGARPYALVNGRNIHAKTPEECLAQVRAAIEAELSALRG